MIGCIAPEGHFENCALSEMCVALHMGIKCVWNSIWMNWLLCTLYIVHSTQIYILLNQIEKKKNNLLVNAFEIETDCNMDVDRRQFNNGTHNQAMGKGSNRIQYTVIRVTGGRFH